MNDNWTCLEQAPITAYEEVCIEACEDDEVFSNFKQDSRYTPILEHVSPEHGERYIRQISQFDINDDLIQSFKENDLYGSANIIDYGEPFGKISPSTLRYITNTLDIAYFVGEGEINKIVEIGGGYGGLCKTISCLCDFDEYHIYDIEAASRLQQKYLSHFEVSKKVHFHSSPEPIQDVDLVISNYSYSELSQELQDIYYENVIANAKRVYMILNKGQVSREYFLGKAEKDFDITVDKRLDFWPPNGYLYFTTMIKK